MNKQEVMKMQTHTLKVNIDCHCDGCKKKIKKMLKKIEGVYSTTIDAEHGKVTVTGNVDPAKLIKQFEKSGKHAELWGGNQIKNMQIDGGKGGGGKDSKSQKGGKGQQVQMMQQPMKGSKDVKMPPPNKDRKSVTFNLNEDDFDASDEDDDFDDDDEFDDEEEYGHGHGQSHNIPSKTMPVMSNGNGPHGMVGGPGFNDKMGGGGKAKKGGGDGFEIPVVMKGKGDSKDGKGGKKGGGGGDGKNAKSKEENKKQGGKDKKDGKSGIGLGFLGFGRKSKKGEDSTPATTKAAANNGSAGGNGNNNGGGAKKGGGKTDTNKMKPGFPENDGTGNGPFPENDGTGNGPKNPGPMGQTGKAPSAAMNGGGGGYYQEMGQGNPYSQQQYMAMMMNQQRQNGNDMFQPMMYAPPHPAINYMQPPIPPPTASDQYTHVFNDENTDSCSIM